MIVSVMITFASVSIIFYQIWQIEHIQSDILSLYAYLSKDHIKDTYNKALHFMREIAEGSFIKQISPFNKNAAGAIEYYQTSMDANQIPTFDSQKKHQRGKAGTIYGLMLKRCGQEIRELMAPVNYRPGANSQQRLPINS